MQESFGRRREHPGRIFFPGRGGRNQFFIFIYLFFGGEGGRSPVRYSNNIVHINENRNEKG